MKDTIKAVSFNCYIDVLSQVDKDAKKKRLTRTVIINQILLNHYKQEIENKENGD